MNAPALKRSILVLVAALLGGCAWKHDFTARSDLEGIFREEFHVALPDSVTEIRGRDVRVGDSWSRWIAFTYDAETVRHITAEAKLTKARPSDLARGEVWARDLDYISPNAPPWWRIRPAEQVTVWYRNSHPTDHAGFTFLWIDEASKTVYVQSAAWR